MKATTTPPPRVPITTGTIVKLTLSDRGFSNTIITFDCIVQSSHIGEYTLYPYKLLGVKSEVYLPSICSRITIKIQKNEPNDVTIYDHIGTAYEYPTLHFAVSIEPYPIGTIVTFEQDI